MVWIFETLADRLGDRYAVLLRGHNYNLREGHRADHRQGVGRVRVSEINDLLLAADVAVLDYSSIRFDWLAHRKAGGVLRAGLGGLSEFAQGSVRLSIDCTWPTAERPRQRLLKHYWTWAPVVSEYAAARELFNKEFNRLHDGRATERVINAFF